MMRKYRNTKVITPDGNFDSKREYRRFLELRLLERAGEIQNLQRQVKYQLIPTQYKKEYTKTGKPKLKVAEREASYFADFVYQMNGETVVEDTKGVRTTEYILKRKLMRYVHGIEIKEV